MAGCNGLRSTGMEFGCTRTYVFDITRPGSYNSQKMRGLDTRTVTNAGFIQVSGGGNVWGLGVRVANDSYRFHVLGQEKCLNVKFMPSEQMSCLDGEFYAFVNL